MDTDSIITPLYQPPSLLPIARHKQSILYTVETTHVTIIIGQTGSGKTTQIPQFLEKAGWCNGGKTIAITQPRRVAATSVAARVAEEMRCQVGEEVGYSIRFEDVTSSKTKIKFLTDGMLLREALVDPLLSRYSVIMVDEAHERSLSSDFLLGLLKKIKKKRPELRIIVSSATLEAESVADFFSTEETEASKQADDDSTEKVSPCRILSIEGRTYSIDILYLSQPAEDYLSKAIEVAMQIHREEPPGDILTFLTGREEIDIVIQRLFEYAANLPSSSDTLQPLPLYAGLPTDQQLYVFSSAAENTRKIICATNIAEASVTVPGIRYVIDTGFVKLRSYNPLTNISSLTVHPISKASATQRAGRAGRTAPGKCFRLYTRTAYTNLSQATTPEIQRSDLAPTLLQLKALGIDNVVRFPFLSPPPPKLLSRALEILYSLGALDDYAKLTSPTGIRMAELPLPPNIAAALLNSTLKEYNCVNEMLTIAAMTTLSSQGSIWFSHDGQQKAMDSSRRKFAAEEGDHLTLLNVFQAFITNGKKEARWCKENHLNYKSMSKAVSIRNQLRRYLERMHVTIPEHHYPQAHSHSKSQLHASQTRGVSATHTPSSAASASTSASTSAHSHPTTPSPSPTSHSHGNASPTTILKCLTTGLFAHAALMHSNGTLTALSSSTSTSTSSSTPTSTSSSTPTSTPASTSSPATQAKVTLHIHPSSLLFNRKAEYVIFSEILQTAGSQSNDNDKEKGKWKGKEKDKIYIKDVSKIDKNWLVECGRGYYTVREKGR